MDTSKSEIDKLLGDPQLFTGNIDPANNTDAKKKGLLKQSISVSRAKQKLNQHICELHKTFSQKTRLF